MFEELVYVGEKPEIDYRTIWFLKGEQLIDINELSTGEQQIVFEGQIYYIKQQMVLQLLLMNQN